MKDNEKIKQYIDDITRELPHSKYASRFGEELLEHLEDSEQDFAEEDETALSKRMIEKIGSKETLLQAYGDFHRSLNVILNFFKVIFYVLLSGLVGIMSHMSFNMFNATLYSYYQNIIDNFTAFAILLILSFQINYIFYRLLYINLHLTTESLKRRKRLLILFILPSLFDSIFFLFDIFPLFIEFKAKELLGVLPAVLPILCTLLPALLGFSIIGKKNRKIPLIQIIPYITLVIFYLALLAHVVENRIPHLPASQLLISIWDGLFGTQYFIFLLMDLIPNLFLSGLPQTGLDLASVNITIILACAYITSITLIGISIFRSANSERLITPRRWLKVIGVMIVSFIFFISLPIGNAGNQKIDWQIPVIEPSRQIEKGQFSILYNFIKFKNSSEGYIYRYDICSDEEKFILIQSSGETFFIKTKGVPSLDKIQITSVGTENEKQACTTLETTRSYDPEIPLFQEDWQCLDKDDNVVKGEWCAKITYKNQEVLRYKEENSLSPIGDINMSADKKWAIIKTSAIYGVDSLYLVDLREFN